jgi:hypothetical protein
MSYLNPLRLHFFGKFQAAVSTVNNDPTHFNNATFKKEYQERGEGATKGWWNPRGDANWRMIGCKITSAWLGIDEPAPDGDAVLSCTIADADHTVAAKLVDLDPEQQGVSEIWGLKIRIANAAGNTLMGAKFETAAFMNLWLRWPSGGGDKSGGAMYQSVLTDIEWGQIDDSPFLQKLREASGSGLLSIKFNVDAFDDDFRSPTFTLGRVAGTIGPATGAEPHHFVIGRHFMTAGLPTPGFFAPAGKVNFCDAVVDETAGKVFLDLGNSLPTSTFGGPFSNLGVLSLAYASADGNNLPYTEFLGNVNYQATGWYQRTAGVVALPEGRKLTSDELQAIASNSLAILLTDASSNSSLAIAEPPGGLYVRADQFVYRLNPGEDAEVQLFASAMGQPYPNAQIVSYLDSTQIGGGPPVGIPTGALQFPLSVVTDSNGRASMKVAAQDPKNPRGYIDGQVYGLRPVLIDTLPPALQYPFNPLEFISFLVWDEFTADPPVWYGCLQPVFQQYANLYPIMDRFLDLASYDSICQNITPLAIVFGLAAEDPNTMPVTRDLSASKRKAILTWLKNLGPDGKPLLGTPVAAGGAAPNAPPMKPLPADVMPGGKLAAVVRVQAAQRSRRKGNG